MKNFFRRKSDLIARTGGEEFTLLIGYEEKERLLEYLEKLRKQIEEKSLKIQENLEEIEIRYTISMGVELDLKESLKEMIISADRKLYKSKERGKNCITF